MGQLIHVLFALGSLAGIAFILWRKIPLLVELEPEAREQSASKPAKGQALRAFASQGLEKTLAKTRQLALRTEGQTAEWLERLRKKSEERKQEFSESYWQHLRKKPRRQKK